MPTTEGGKKIMAVVSGATLGFTIVIVGGFSVPSIVLAWFVAFIVSKNMVKVLAS